MYMYKYIIHPQWTPFGFSLRRTNFPKHRDAEKHYLRTDPNANTKGMHSLLACIIAHMHACVPCTHACKTLEGQGPGTPPQKQNNKLKREGNKPAPATA